MTNAKPDPDWQAQQQRPLIPAGRGDEELVFDWRLGELMRAGYPLTIAEKVAAAAHVDLHQAIALLERGCAPETAAKILL